MTVSDIIKNAIDLHVHIGPESIPRKFDISTLRAAERGRLAAIGVKNHFFPTVAMTGLVSAKSEPRIIPSVTLNESLGGLNPEIIRASAMLATEPLIVWMPTISARNVIRRTGEPLPAAWFGGSSVPKQVLPRTRGISVIDSRGNITLVAKKVLRMIRQTGSILATGHLSWKESQVLVRMAMEKYGIRSVIVTHPIYQPISMPISVQQELADRGAYIEQCYSMFSMDGISIRRIVSQILAVGPKQCIISSDVGQAFSPQPSVALERFTRLLVRQGVTLDDVEAMLVRNPADLLAKAGIRRD